MYTEYNRLYVNKKNGREGEMEQNLHFNATCDLVDVIHCSQYYVDPCNCTQYYECALNQMFHRPCAPGTISHVYNNGSFGCVFPNDSICQPESPWKRCNVTESRMTHLVSVCGKSVTTNNTPSNSNQNTNGIDGQTTMQTIVPAIVGALVFLAILVGLVINRYRRYRAGQDIYSVTPERPYDSLCSSRMTRESIYAISDGSMGSPESIYAISDGSMGSQGSIYAISDGSMGSPERLTRNDEIHLSDPYNSYNSFDTSTPEYCPCETRRFNPMYGVDLNQPSVSDSSQNSVSDQIVHISTLPQPNDVQSANTQEGETVSRGDEPYLIVEGSGLTPSPSTMPEGRDDDRECIARGVQSGNRPIGEIVLNEDSSFSIAGESDTTTHPLSMPRPCDADRPDKSWNTHKDELASSNNSSYVKVLASDLTAMPQARDADREYLDCTVSSEDSAYVFVEQPGPLFHPYNSGKGPWHHKVIFNTKEHYFPYHVEPTPCTTFATT